MVLNDQTHKVSLKVIERLIPFCQRKAFDPSIRQCMQQTSDRATQASVRATALAEKGPRFTVT